MLRLFFFLSCFFGFSMTMFGCGSSPTASTSQGGSATTVSITTLQQILTPSDLGLSGDSVVADASADRLSDGRVRLYFFATGRGIVSAISSDGVNFTVEEGSRLPDGYGMPRVYRLSDTQIRLYVIGNGGILSALSSDGLTFTVEEGVRVRASDVGVENITCPTIVDKNDGGYRMYFSDLPPAGGGVSPHQIYSATSTDLLNWTVESGVRVGTGASPITSSAEHPFALRRTDGTIFLFYYVNSGTELRYAISSDGLLFSEETGSGLNGNDPDLLVDSNGTYFLYYGGQATNGGVALFAASLTFP